MNPLLTTQEDLDHDKIVKQLLVPLKEHLSTRPKMLESPHLEILVLDIDGTAINDIHHTRSEPALQSVLDLYTHARECGYGIVFLTGRKANLYQRTMASLCRAGYTTWTHLILYPNELPHTVELIHTWKDLQRKWLKEQGFHIVACVGDQPMDTEGQHIGELQVRLPCPPGRECCIS